MFFLDMKFFLLSLLILMFVKCSDTPTLKIATSSNMKFAMEEIIDLFQLENEVEIDIIEGSSGKLTSQIEFGAPYDIFVSADTTYPNYLFNNGFSETKPTVYAFGKLVIWSLSINNPSLKELTSSDIKSIAIPNSKTAPYGGIIKTALENSGIYDRIYAKFIFAESVTQCDQYIVSKSVDIGITSMASVKSRQLNNSGYWTEIDSTLYPFLPQSAMLIHSKDKHPDAVTFYKFLVSEQVKLILKKYGYKVH